MSAVLSVLIGACVVVGLFFMTVGTLGILRFPDVYTRLHADTKATTFGSLFLGLASGLCATQAWLAGEAGEPTSFWLHAAFAVVVLAVTNAAGGHAIARAAWRAGQRPVGVVDQLAEAREKGRTGLEEAPVVEEEKAGEEAAMPESPETPEVSESPETTGTTETTEALERPETPERPEGPETPGGPMAPEAPENPEVPEAPEAPAEPAAPESPAGAEAAGVRAIKWAVVDPEGGAV
jgi:multicomponent Na+:H+ antiporter subunit G